MNIKNFFRIHRFGIIMTIIVTIITVYFASCTRQGPPTGSEWGALIGYSGYLFIDWMMQKEKYERSKERVFRHSHRYL